jgi:hypothetical protein
MRIHCRSRLLPHVPPCRAAVLFLWLGNVVLSAQSQDLNWTPNPVINDPSWFIAGNWRPPGPPTTAESASVSSTIAANVAGSGAVANELLIGATLTSGDVIPTGTAGTVIVNGPSASLTLSGRDSARGY